MHNKTSIILDSGAFSAWMKQEEISIDSYAEFALSRIDKIDYVVNLDVIPGKFGMKDIGDEELERAANTGWDNYDRLIKLGIPVEKIIHVFHQGEKFKHLERMIDTMGYIGISPANDRTTKEKIKWLDSCMKYVIDKNGNPVVKFHGFAVTSLPIINRYPWYSVDSTSWVTYGKFGAILFPKTKLGKLDWISTPHIIFLSNKSPKKEIAGSHYDTLSSIEQDKVRKYIEERGFSLKEARNNGLVRDRINMIFYIELENHLKNIRIYYAGNFPMLSKMEREYKTREIALKFTDEYKRLCSFYYKNYAEKTLLLKEKNNERGRKKRSFRRVRKRKIRNSK